MCRQHAWLLQVKLAACRYVVGIVSHEKVQVIYGLRCSIGVELPARHSVTTATLTGPVPEPAVPPQARHAPHRPRYELRYPQRSQSTPSADNPTGVSAATDGRHSGRCSSSASDALLSTTKCSRFGFFLFYSLFAMFLCSRCRYLPQQAYVYV